MLNLEKSVESRKSAHPIGAPRKTMKALFTNQVITTFLAFLCTPMVHTPFSRPTNFPRFNSKTNQGFTLVELIITVVLSGIAVVMFAGIYTSTQVRSVSPVMQVKAAELAQAYLEEISLKRFDEQSPVGNQFRCDEDPAIACSGTLINEGESRALFDDVDDYNGLNESPPRDALNNIRNGFNGFEVNVSVNYAGGDQGFSARDLKRIEVAVTSPEGDLFVFSVYKGNF